MVIRPAGLLVRQGRLLTTSYRYGAVTRHTLPGGNLEPGELLSDCLQREFREELGLTITVAELLWVAQTHAGGRDVLHLLFRSEADQDREPVLNVAATRASGVAWLAAAELATVSLYPDLRGPLQCLLTTSSEPSPCYLGQIDQDWI
ncbi:MAG: NUDIX hydrolase [Magnetococcales bacterium]|nr:NUDIX hydrolase [Magnetococcales bacterium]